MKKKTEKQKLIDECVNLAIKICLAQKPRCEFCLNPAQTAHHIIHQARSNFLRCDQKNLVSVCGSCHASIHIGQNEGIKNLQLTKMRGSAWRNYILANERKKIKNDMFYWKKMKILLESELNSLR